MQILCQKSSENDLNYVIINKIYNQLCKNNCQNVIKSVQSLDKSQKCGIMHQNFTDFVLRCAKQVFPSYTDRT